MRQLFGAVLIAALVVWLGPVVSAEPAPLTGNENLITR